MEYCGDCGAKLVIKNHKNEGEVPFCERCEKFVFPLYNVAVSVITVDEARRKILLIQQYGKKNFVLVSGYVNKGESAEHAVERELREETGLKAGRIRYCRSRYFAPTDTLMLNFICTIDGSNEVELTDEVDYAEWFDEEEAAHRIKPDSLADFFLTNYLDERARSEADMSSS